MSSHKQSSNASCPRVDSRAHQLGAHQLDRVSVSSWDKVRWGMRTRIVQNWLFGRLNIAQAIGIFAVLGLGVWLAFRGEVKPGAVTAADLLYQRIIGPVNGLMYVMDDFQEALSSLSRLVGVVEVRYKSEGQHNSDTSPADNQNRPLVKIQDLDFAYPNGFQALKGIDVDIAPGETIAVVGATGSGKSTLASLVAGVYPPSSGRLERSIAADEVYSLSQETHVFIGTVRSNLTLAKPEATEQEIIDALHRTGAHGFVMALPEGLDTAGGHGARNLEPAQAQHLALARMSLLNLPLIILDEATAEADSADAEVLNKASLAITANSAAIVTAHRLSQAVSCDRILVMDNGRIIESGTHEQLLDTETSYARLWQAWSEGATL